MLDGLAMEEAKGCALERLGERGGEGRENGVGREHGSRLSK